MTAAEKRRRAQIASMVAGNIRHAELVAAAVRRAIASGERDPDTGASMLRSIANKIERWRGELRS